MTIASIGGGYIVWSKRCFTHQRAHTLHMVSGHALASSNSSLSFNRKGVKLSTRNKSIKQEQNTVATMPVHAGEMNS